MRELSNSIKEILEKTKFRLVENELEDWTNGVIISVKDNIYGVEFGAYGNRKNDAMFPPIVSIKNIKRNNAGKITSFVYSLECVERYNLRDRECNILISEDEKKDFVVEQIVIKCLHELILNIFYNLM